jgi:hypothetical protein
MKVNERGNHVYRDEEADVRMGMARGAERYHYDFDDAFRAAGWRQYDTTQDAWYFGVWVLVALRKVFTYCEGDRVLVECPSIDSFKMELQYMQTFYGEPPPAFRVLDARSGQITEIFGERPVAG